jgi:hypothetical protein
MSRDYGIPAGFLGSSSWEIEVEHANVHAMYVILFPDHAFEVIVEVFQSWSGISDAVQETKELMSGREDKRVYSDLAGIAGKGRPVHVGIAGYALERKGYPDFADGGIHPARREKSLPCRL